MERPTVIVAAAMAAVAVAAAWMFRLEPAPAVPEPAPPPTVVAAASLVVHVSGHVAAPGLVTLEEGDRVADAVAAAGGLLPGADLTSVNLAAPAVDGARVHVPGPGERSPVPTGGEVSARVAVNRATAADLQRLPGVGPVLAERIVAHREASGPFEVVEDLLDVPGIGERTLEALRDLVEVP